MYPEYNWDLKEARRVPQNWWKEMANQREFMDSIARELKMTSHYDWYTVGRDEIVQRGGSRLLKLYGDSVIKGKRQAFEQKSQQFLIHESVLIDLGWPNQSKRFHELKNVLLLKTLTQIINL